MDDSNHSSILDVLLVRPGAYPQQIQLKDDLDSLQKAVGGYYEAVYPFSDPVAIVCNDEGRLEGLPLNRALRDDVGNPYDVVAGDFIVVGLTDDSFASLPPEFMEKYEAMFHSPETFIQIGHSLLVFETPEECIRDPFSEPDKSQKHRQGPDVDLEG